MPRPQPGKTAKKATGAPAAALPPYEGQQRFYDGDLHVKDWTADLALRCLNVDADAPLVDQRSAAEDAEENALLPPEALEALRRAGVLR